MDCMWWNIRLSHTDSPSCSHGHIFGQAWPQRFPQTFHARFRRVRHLCQATQTAQGAYKIFYKKKMAQTKCHQEFLNWCFSFNLSLIAWPTDIRTWGKNKFLRYWAYSIPLREACEQCVKLQLQNSLCLLKSFLFSLRPDFWQWGIESWGIGNFPNSSHSKWDSGYKMAVIKSSIF